MTAQLTSGNVCYPKDSTMRRLTNRLLLFVVTSFLIVPASCIAATASEKIETAQKLFFDCQVKNVQAINDNHLEAEVVALKLTNHCLDEYKALNKITARYNYDTSNEQRMYKLEQNSERLKIDASLPLVNMNR